jgi:hypothetical protein
VSSLGNEANGSPTFRDPRVVKPVNGCAMLRLVAEYADGFNSSLTAPL